MSNILKLEALGIDLRNRTGGQIKTKCPKCYHPGQTLDLSVNIDDGVYNCKSINCGWKGSVGSQARELTKKIYTLPELKNDTDLSDAALRWFSNRKISQFSLNYMHVRSVKTYMPQTGKEETCIAFPYLRDDVVVNVKYRDARKNMKLEKDAELVFYNLNAIFNPDVDTILITEGEIDALSFVEIGVGTTYKNIGVVSVPNGASVGAMTYFDSAWENLDKKKKFVIAGDTDAPGVALQKELIRRLDAVRCYTINWDDCKDANEYLVKYGKDALLDKLNNAVPVPLEGIVTVEDSYEDIMRIYNEGLKQGALTQHEEVNELISFEPGYLTVITGSPGAGKGEYVDETSVGLSLVNDWRFGVLSLETRPISYHISMLVQRIIGNRFGHGINSGDRITQDELFSALEFINSHYYFLEPKDYTITSILNCAKQLVLRYGINGLIIDPWNRMLEEDNGKKGTEYIQWCLGQIINFNKRNLVHTFLVAHPAKLQKKYHTEEYPVPTLKDICGSKDFEAMADIGISVYRRPQYDGENLIDETTEIHIQKRRFNHWGRKPIRNALVYNWNPLNGRYYQSVPDNNNWLKIYKK